MTATLFDEQPEPIRPYWQDDQPSSGWSGSDTSKASEPYRLTKQQQTWMIARDAGRRGVTWSDVSEKLGLKAHHGTASACLTNLHTAGHLARLTEIREGRKVYVLPHFIDDRATEAPSHRASRRDIAEAAFNAGKARGMANAGAISGAPDFDEWWKLNG